jgi:hypothetical protein
VHTVNRNTQPSSSEVLRGEEQTSEYLREVCSREMTHRVEEEVVGEGGNSFHEAPEYPHGLRVLGVNADLSRGGKAIFSVRVLEERRI